MRTAKTIWCTEGSCREHIHLTGNEEMAWHPPAGWIRHEGSWLCSDHAPEKVLPVDALVEFFAGDQAGYHLGRLKEALQTVPNNGDWHGELSNLLDRFVTPKNEAEVRHWSGKKSQ